MRVYRYSNGSTGKAALRHGTATTAWERRNVSVDLKRARSQSPLLRGLSTFSNKGNERFPCPTQNQDTSLFIMLRWSTNSINSLISQTM
jgi:hypothetical protein